MTFLIYCFVDDEDDYDVFKQSSTADYLICTSTSSTKKSNPVIGFTLYQDPTCIVTLLGNGQLVSLAIMTMSMIPTIEDMDDEDVEQINSPLKKVNIFFAKTLICATKLRFFFVLDARQSI